jgi:LytS/YehU family sensor histidine kinase
VEARSEDAGVRVSVESTGRLDPAAEPESGLGLANAAERLRRLCGDGATLAVRQADPATVRAEVFLPTAMPAVS